MCGICSRWRTTAHAPSNARATAWTKHKGCVCKCTQRRDVSVLTRVCAPCSYWARCRLLTGSGSRASWCSCAPPLTQVKLRGLRSAAKMQRRRRTRQSPQTSIDAALLCCCVRVTTHTAARHRLASISRVGTGSPLGSSLFLARSSAMAQSLNILPRTVASFYGSTVPRPYVVCDALGEVKQDRVAKPRVNAALVGACRSALVPRLGRRARCTRPARAAAPAYRCCARAWRGLSPDKSPRAEWARSQSWSRGGLLADAVLRSAGRTTDASGRRKLRAEGDEEDEEVRATARAPFHARRSHSLVPAPPQR